MVGNIRRCRKHVRAIDLSPLCPIPGAPDLLYLLRRLFLLAGAGCIRGYRLRRRHRERSARGSTYAESSSERPRVDGRDGKRGTAKGCDGRGVDTLLGISTYDCPGGVHRSAKQSSPGLDPSRALRALFSAPPPERGNVSRYTREHRGVGYLSTVRCCCLVSGSIYSTRTHDLRNSRGSPMWLSFLLSLSSSLSLVCVYVCLPPSRSPTIFFSYRGNGSAGVADLRRAEFGRRSFVLARYFR